MDKILIEGLECMAHVGVPEEERGREQRVSVDIELVLDLKPAGTSDQFEKTVDYAAVAQIVREMTEKKQFCLVEALAEAVAGELMGRFRPEEAVVRVRKFSVPGTASVGAEIKRTAGRSRTMSEFPKAGPRRSGIPDSWRNRRSFEK